MGGGVVLVLWVGFVVRRGEQRPPVTHLRSATRPPAPSSQLWDTFCDLPPPRTLASVMGHILRPAPRPSHHLWDTFYVETEVPCYHCAVSIDIAHKQAFFDYTTRSSYMYACVCVYV